MDTIGTQHFVRYSEVSLNSEASSIFLVGVVLRNLAVEYNVAAFSELSTVVRVTVYKRTRRYNGSRL